MVHFTLIPRGDGYIVNVYTRVWWLWHCVYLYAVSELNVWLYYCTTVIYNNYLPSVTYNSINGERGSLVSGLILIDGWMDGCYYIIRYDIYIIHVWCIIGPLLESITHTHDGIQPVADHDAKVGTPDNYYCCTMKFIIINPTNWYVHVHASLD